MSIFKPNTPNLVLVESTASGLDTKLLNVLKAKYNYSFDCLDQITALGKHKTGSVEEVIDFCKTTLPVTPYVTQRTVTKIAVIVDADHNPTKRFNKIKHAFAENNDIFAVPQELGKFAHDRNKVNVGVYLFPDNNQKGSIEALILNCLKNEYTDIAECVKSMKKCVQEKKSGFAMINDANSSKASIRTLASFINPDRYVDSSIDLVNFNSPAIACLNRFLSELR